MHNRFELFSRIACFALCVGLGLSGCDSAGPVETEPDPPVVDPPPPPPVTPPRPEPTDTLWVATTGNDATGDGSATAPFATITAALDAAADGALVLVRPGLYTGLQRLRGTFAQGVTVRSQEPYHAQLRNAGNRVVVAYTHAAGAEGITVEGFDIAHSGPGGPLVVHVDGDGRGAVSRITFRNNVIHDSYDNDLLKVNNAATDVVIEGNLFYNQTGPDEHLDINGTQRVVVQDNVFFNDFVGSGRANPSNTGSFVVIKDSNGASDALDAALETTVRRNVFLNYQGDTGYTFVLAGEDGMPNHEAVGVVVENNLMLGNSDEVMRAAFGVKGARDVVFRNNTVSGDLPSRAFALRVRTEGQNPPNEEIEFFNNVWSDPTGTMGSWQPGDPNDFSDAPPSQTLSFAIDSNVYWNAGAVVPSDPAELIDLSDDRNATVGDPRLEDPRGLTVPRWNPSTSTFADGSTSIREVFVRLVERYGTPGANSAVFGAADPAQAPADDILGRTRLGTDVDAGAVQVPR